MKINDAKPYFINLLLTVALCAAYGLLGGLPRVFLGLLLSALLGVTFYQYHYGYGLLQSLVILTLLVLFLQSMPALAAGVPLILLALALALGTRFRLGVYWLLLLCSFLFVSDLMVQLELAKHLSGGTLTLSSLLLDMGRQLREALSAQLPQPEAAAFLEKMVTVSIDLSLMLAPALFMVSGVVLSYVLLALYKRLQRGKADLSFLLPFDRMQGDRLMGLVYLVLGLLATAAPKNLFFDLASNVLFVLSFLFFVLGLSVLACVLRRRGVKKWNRRLILAACVFFSSMLFMLPAMVLLFFGLSDCFLDYRKLRPHKEEP